MQDKKIIIYILIIVFFSSYTYANSDYGILDYWRLDNNTYTNIFYSDTSNRTLVGVQFETSNANKTGKHLKGVLLDNDGTTGATLDDDMLIADNPIYNQTASSGNFTLRVWVNFTGEQSAGNQYILRFGGSTGTPSYRIGCLAGGGGEYSAGWSPADHKWFLSKSNKACTINIQNKSSTTTLPTGNFIHAVLKVENHAAILYINGEEKVRINNTASVQPASFSYIGIGGEYYGQSVYGVVDEFVMWNRSLSYEEILEDYNNGTGKFYISYTSINFYNTYETNTYTPNNTFNININTSNFNTTPNITLNIYNQSGYLVNSTSTNDFNLSYIAFLNYGTYYYNATATDGLITVYTETRTINIYNLTLHDITLPYNNYNQTSRYINISWTNGTSNYPSIIYPNMYYLFLLNNDTTLNRSINNTINNYYYYDLFYQNLSIGNYLISVCVNYTLNAGYYCKNNSFNLKNNAELILYVKHSNNTGTYNITNYTLHDYTREINTITTIEPLILNIVKNNTYNFMINDTAGLYAYYYFNYSTNNYTNEKVIYLLPSNSINITIRDEYLYNIITQNTTVKFEKTNSPISYTYTTNNGLLFPYNLVAGEYIMTITSTNPVVYNTKYYTINIYDRTSQEFTAYINNGGVVLLTYRSQTGEPLSNVEVKIYRTINNTYTLVESLITQIDGRTQFNYIPNTKYIIKSVLDGYDNLTFELNPVLFTSYDVTMRLLESDVIEPTAYAEWTPKNFIKGQYGDITFKIYSTYCSLENYNVRTYINGILNFSYTGNNPCSELLYIPYDFSNINSNTTLTLIYNYSLNNNKSQEFRSDYYVVIPLTNRTISNMGNNTYGFGVGDRVLIVTIINIVVFGVGFLFSGVIFGLLMVFLNTLIFVNTNFIPSPLFYIIFVVGLIIIMSKGVNDG